MGLWAEEEEEEERSCSVANAAVVVVVFVVAATTCCCCFTSADEDEADGDGDDGGDKLEAEEVVELMLLLSKALLSEQITVFPLILVGEVFPALATFCRSELVAFCCSTYDSFSLLTALLDDTTCSEVLFADVGDPDVKVEVATWA